MATGSLQPGMAQIALLFFVVIFPLNDFRKILRPNDPVQISLESRLIGGSSLFSPHEEVGFFDMGEKAFPKIDALKFLGFTPPGLQVLPPG